MPYSQVPVTKKKEKFFEIWSGLRSVTFLDRSEYFRNWVAGIACFRISPVNILNLFLDTEKILKPFDCKALRFVGDNHSFRIFNIFQKKVTSYFRSTTALPNTEKEDMIFLHYVLTPKGEPDSLTF